MSQFVIIHEPAIRLGAFLVILVTMAAWEGLAPRRGRLLARARRWPVNLAIVFIDTLAVRLLFPTAVVGVALWAEARGIGLLHGLALPAWAEIAATMLALDLVIYGQHVAMHKVGPLWRLHRMHHADLDVDATTALRFHPAEIVLSVLIKFAAVVALGAPPAGVILFEVILNGSAMFNHSNIRLGGAVDGFLRLAVVTPDMHRVHHSVITEERDHNYGFALSVWDRLFGTYRAQPRAGHASMSLGLPRFRRPEDGRLWALLANPLRA